MRLFGKKLPTLLTLMLFDFLVYRFDMLSKVGFSGERFIALLAFMAFDFLVYRFDMLG